jgi:hypothetical protein
VEAKAKTRGIDFNTKFDVPVFKTEESSADFVLDDSAIQQYAIETSPEDLIRKLKLSLEATHSGVQYRFPAARNKVAAFALTVFFAIWTAGVVAMVKFGAPMFMSIIFGLVDVAVFWGFLDAWLISSRVEISHRVVTVTRGLFGLGAPKVIRREDVEDVEIVRGSQSGQTVFYSITLFTNQSKKVKLGNGLIGRKDAETLAAQIKAAIMSDE